MARAETAAITGTHAKKIQFANGSILHLELPAASARLSATILPDHGKAMESDSVIVHRPVDSE
ncbi:MAG: hypothetical protein AAGD07_22230 [Planctomycetota bacterium]